MNRTLWIVQAFLALAFIAIGGMKVFVYEKYKALSEKNGPGIPRALATFIGVSQLAAAVGLILPMATGVAPWLTPLAAVGIAAIMVLAVGFHVRRHEWQTGPVVFFFLAMFVVVGRFSHWT